MKLEEVGDLLYLFFTCAALFCVTVPTDSREQCEAWITAINNAKNPH